MAAAGFPAPKTPATSPPSKPSSRGHSGPQRRGAATTNDAGSRVYQSNIKSRSAVVHLIGDEQGNIANGVDSFQASYLLGFETSLSERVNALLRGETRRGDDVTLTVDSALSTEIVNIFSSGSATRGKSGAALVMNYKTGEVLAMVSLPVFDPAGITDRDRSNPQHPFWNRALQSTLPPGSTFKIITAAAALENMADATGRLYECTGATQVLDRVIHDYGMAQHGQLTLERAFTVSCNNAFAQAALLMGDTALRRMAESFGFNDNFLFGIGGEQPYPQPTATPWRWPGAALARPGGRHAAAMCMVAAPSPTTRHDGAPAAGRCKARRVVHLHYSQKACGRVCTQQTAQTIAGFMKNVVAKGTGTAAGVNGLTIAGKTGSAEGAIDGQEATHAWFVGYIDNPALPYAACVLVEGGGSGGSVAAPLAAQIFKYMKDHYTR